MVKIDRITGVKSFRTVRFQREKGGSWESGLLISNGTGSSFITTMAGEQPTVWTYIDADLHGQITVDFAPQGIQITVEY